MQGPLTRANVQGSRCTFARVSGPSIIIIISQSQPQLQRRRSQFTVRKHSVRPTQRLRESNYFHMNTKRNISMCSVIIREISTSMFRPRGQNAPGKIGEKSPAGYTHWKAALQRSTLDQVARYYFSNLTWFRVGVEPTKLLEIAENREIFRVLGLLPPRPSSEEKRQSGYENEWDLN